MTILYCDQLEVSGSYLLRCSGCFGGLDIVDTQCINWHLLTGERPFCFDCEPMVADRLPAQLYVDAPNYWLGIDNNWFFIRCSPTESLFSRILEIMYTREDADRDADECTACLVSHISTVLEGSLVEDGDRVE